MGEKCRMRCCNNDAYGSDTIWIVDPSNTSEKPVCKYHYTMRKLMESSAFPVFILLATYTVALNFNDLSGPVAFLFSFILSFLAVSILTFTALIGIELSRRYLTQDTPILGENVRVVDEKGDLNDNNCCVCGESSTQGIWTKYENTVEFFGIPVKTKKRGVNHYCSNECRLGKQKSDSKERSIQHAD